jgi:hypothetical protein
MIPRLLVVVIFSQVYVSGCSQAVAPVPRGPALTSPSSLSRLAAGALPKVRFFNTPTAGSWPKSAKWYSTRTLAGAPAADGEGWSALERAPRGTQSRLIASEVQP